MDDTLKGEITAEHVHTSVASKVTVDTEGTYAKTSTCVAMGPMLVSASESHSFDWRVIFQGCPLLFVEEIHFGLKYLWLIDISLAVLTLPPLSLVHEFRWVGR